MVCLLNDLSQTWGSKTFSRSAFSHLGDCEQWGKGKTFVFTKQDYNNPV